MFDALKAIGADSLAVKLVYYRGRDCKATNWEHDPGVCEAAYGKALLPGRKYADCQGAAPGSGGKRPLSGVVLIADVYEENPRD